MSLGAVARRLHAEFWAVPSALRPDSFAFDGGIPPSKAKESGRKAEGTAQNSAWRRRATAPNDIWSYDFMSGRTRHGGPIRILNIVDEFTRVALGTHVSRSIGSADLQDVLEKTINRHGVPRLIRSDNGREFISTTIIEWLEQRGIEAAFIEKGRPQQNAYVERFNGSMRRELLNQEEFDSVLEARVLIEEWVDQYNTVRPHRGLKMLTPLAFSRAYSEGTK